MPQLPNIADLARDEATTLILFSLNAQVRSAARLADALGAARAEGRTLEAVSCFAQLLVCSEQIRQSAALLVQTVADPAGLPAPTANAA